MRRSGAAAALVLLALLALGVRPAAGGEGAVHVASYPYERVWPAALRFLRVDLKLKITEKDESAGYVLFEYVDDGKSFHGAMELSRSEDDRGRAATRMALRIDGRPSYVEEHLLTKLDRKLYEELGEPAPPPAPPPDDADPPKDEAKPDGKDKDKKGNSK